jgi:hypothetical protein
VLRKWVKEFGADPQDAFPAHCQMKPEQLEIDRLRREVQKLKGRAGCPKKAAAYFAKDRREVRLHREAPGDPGGVVVRDARWLAGLTRSRNQRRRSDEELGAKVLGSYPQC